MLGSAIPRRWVLSLALVGLVSVFMASYAAVWTDSASATTVPGDFLDDVVGPGSINMQAGSSLVFGANAIDDNGNIRTDLPGVLWFWNPGSCGSFDDVNAANPVFTASGSSCSASVFVHATQGGGAIPPGGFEIVINVLAPPPTDPAPPAPVDPPSFPTFTPPGFSSDGSDQLFPSTGGVINLPLASVLTQTFDFNVPPGAIPDSTQVVFGLREVDPGDVPPPPPAQTEGSSSGTFEFGSAIVEIQAFDSGQSPIEPFSFDTPSQVCLPTGPSDYSGHGGPEGLNIWSSDGPGDPWQVHPTDVFIGDSMACARTSHLTFFALGLDTTPPSADEGETATGLPATGDYAPGITGLILAMIAGIGLLATGAFTVRRTRRSRVDS